MESQEIEYSAPDLTHYGKLASMGVFRTQIALPVAVRKELERSQIFLSLDPEASGILRIAIVPAEERFLPAGQGPTPAVYWISSGSGPRQVMNEEPK